MGLLDQNGTFHIDNYGLTHDEFINKLFWDRERGHKHAAAAQGAIAPMPIYDLHRGEEDFLRVVAEAIAYEEFSVSARAL